MTPDPFIRPEVLQAISITSAFGIVAVAALLCWPNLPKFITGETK